MRIALIPNARQLGLVALALVLMTGPAAVLSVPAARAEQPELDAASARGEAYAHLMRALLAARRGEFRTATAEVRRAIKVQPDVPEVYIEGASLLRSIGRYQDAEQLARQALTVDPSNGDALRFLADQTADRALASRPDPELIEEALDLYAQLARVRPLDEESLRKRTNLRMLSGDLQGAIASASELFDSRPGDADVAQMYYRLLVHNQQEQEALEVLLRFVVRHPDERPLIEEADRLAAKLDAWDTVVQFLDGPDDLGGRASLAQALRGQALLRLGRIEDAIFPLERALATDSRNRRLRLGLVVAYRSVGRLADAAALAGRLAQQNPDDPMFQLILAETLDQQRDVDAALEKYGSALVLMRGAPTEDGWHERDAIRLRIAELYLGREEYEKSHRVLATLERPGAADSMLLLSRLAVANEDWEAARAAVDDLREVGAGGEAELLEGEILLRTGPAAGAEARLRAGIDALGDRHRFGVARLYQEQGQSGVGEMLLREWVVQSPRDADAQFDLGRYYYLLERFEEAEAALLRALELDPEHAPAMNFLGYSWAERSTRLDEALGLIERALSIDAWDGAYLDSLGWVYYQMGRFEAARDPLERAAREYPKDPTILEHLGDLYVELGEQGLAVMAWERALEAEPAEAEALRDKILEAQRPARDAGADEESASAERTRNAGKPPIRP